MVEVRRAGPDDAAAIAAVHVGTWQVAYRGLMPDEDMAERTDEIGAIYVHPEVWRTGVGRALMDSGAKEVRLRASITT